MCGAQVELTEEQERVARQLLEARETPKPKAKAAEPIPAWADPVERPASPPKKRPVENSPPPAPKRTLIPPPPKRRPIRPPSVPLIAQVVDDRPKVLVARPADALPVPTDVSEESMLYGRRWLQNLISALASLLVNMLVIILLGLIEFQMPPREPVLMIEVDASPDSGGRVGSEVVVKEQPKKPEPAVKEPTPEAPVEPQTSKKPEVVATLPALDTKALTEKLIPAIEPVALPPISGGSGSGSPVNGTLLASRDHSLRTKVLNIEGGNERTELAVAMGLKWIATHQNRNGSWSLESFDDAGECRGRCKNTGHATSDTAATGLALLPFLGAGYTHKGNHDYRETVQEGLDWLVANQKPDGDLRGRGNGRMYAHGQAAIALCEAYALTRDSKLRRPAQLAIDFIVKAQHSAGGWRYEPGEQGDTSVVGWQIMALRSAQMAGLSVPTNTFDKSDDFLTSVQSSPSEAKYSYMPGHQFSNTMTAEGLLCRLYSGWRPNFPPLLHGVDWLLKSHLPTEVNLNMYYVYYATQALHHVGGDRWTKWNERMKKVLIATQSKDGHMAGSWQPLDGHDRVGGRLYMTALAVCTLEVYYRHMPLYKNSTKQPGR